MTVRDEKCGVIRLLDRDGVFSSHDIQEVMNVMKRFLAALALALCLPACALGEIAMTQLADAGSGSTLVAFEIAQDHTLSDMVRMALEMQIEARFAQKAVLSMLDRAGAQIAQEGFLWQDGSLVSMARTWQGEQQNGRDGSSAACLTVSLETGFEIYMDELFADFDGAVAAMEAIIEADVLAGMNAYMENTDLLPMPTNSFFVDETGLTVFYPQERYSYFDGTSGSVTFYWHEIADYIGENSPVYALSRPQENSAEAIRNTADGFGHAYLALGKSLGEAMEPCTLTDEPDYTANAIVYGSGDARLRGVSVEIPKYAETAPADTPISALRHSCVSFHGLTTGKSTKEDILALLGEPDAALVYSEDAAYDALLVPGESLVYACAGGVLEAHMDEDGVLSCLILRLDMPEI